MAGTVVVTRFGGLSNFLREIICTCVGDASTGSFPAIVLPAFEGRIQALKTVPGTPNPTANWGATLTEAGGVDLLAGLGAGQSATVAKRVPVFYATTDENPVVAMNDVLTLNVTGNAVNSAQLVVVLFYSVGIGA